METARGIKALGHPFVLRAGIWKPRTRPGSFEGVGYEGLKWLKDAGDELEVPVTTEVATAYHVEACLEHGIDMLWLGARTTVNPFSVQEIAEALSGVDIPVMVKNPIHPDMGLWIGALERINRAGITKLAAVHRGFHHHDNAPYRNQPDWEMPIELKSRHKDLPIICDASHISGTPELIPRVAQRALDLDMDGLLIETHREPTAALSDAQQQVTPQELGHLLDGLVLRRSNLEQEDHTAELADLRARIDQIDESILRSLADRMSFVGRIGEQKRDESVAIFQVERWNEIISNYAQHGEELGLRSEFVQRILEAIHLESIERQQHEMESQPKSNE